MKLYHGTNVDFSEIDLSKCKPYKDFGQGFYLTNIKNRLKSKLYVDATLMVSALQSFKRMNLTKNFSQIIA